MNTAHTALGCSAGWRRSADRLALLAICLSFAIVAAAAEVKVLSAEAFAPMVAAMAPMF